MAEFRFCPMCATPLQWREELEDGGAKLRLRCSACHGQPPENLRSIRHGEALAHMARRLQLIHDGHGQVGHADGAGLLAGHQG